MVIVWGSEEDVKTAVNEIIIRAKEATIGIPSETRQAMSDGTNGFERILPGADRMYPDTDLPPKKITKEKIDQIKSWMPEQFWKRIEWYFKLGIPKDTIEELSVSKYAELFKKAVSDWKINPTTAAVFLIQYPKRLKKFGIQNDWLNEELLESILKSFADKKIPQDALLTTLKTVAELGIFTEEVIPNPAVEKEIDEIINTAKSECDRMTIYNQDSKGILLMGMIMKKLRGRISAKVIADKIGFVKGVK
jgi:glutamyl-tRNA(Gln) amidotransferase subunit E